MNKAQLGQYLTPSSIANFMASLFSPKEQYIKLLDAGAGIGSLTIAAVNNVAATVGEIDLWELDSNMIKYLESNLKFPQFKVSINNTDFIKDAVNIILKETLPKYTHVILNPPYKKINSNSSYRKNLSLIGIETVNLYPAFVSLSILLTESMGQIVAIIPRSFCNGPYYRSFRKFILSSCSIEQIHLFGSRNQAFKDDSVLQENIIIKLIKGKVQGDVKISHSENHNFLDLTSEVIPFNQVIKNNDPECFIHIPKTNKVVISKLFNKSLAELKLSVSTGPVVDFRVKENWAFTPNQDTVPLIYPHNFVNKQLVYPKFHKKPNSLVVDDNIKKWLYPNGNYVLVKRFSSKEEKKRVVAYLYESSKFNSSSYVGFENHFNLIHFNKSGLETTLAKGLICFLNSSIVDEYFRVFSGHTQVNATDLKNIKYPTLEVLHFLGKAYNVDMSQVQIDQLIKEAEELA